MPNFGRAAHPRVLAKLALDAEAGWDGFFLWDHLVEWDRRLPIHASFTSLAAMAEKTERIRLRTTVAPLTKTKPWLVVRQMATLDPLSNGRMMVGVGLSTGESTNYERFGEVVEG